MNRKNIYYWLLLPVLALMMGACSESNNNEEPDKPDTPVNPVDPGDWQTVPTAGGTIERGDIALTFPQGTFSKEEKVAIKEVKQGELFKEFEASTFYQLTLPASNNKPISVKIKSNGKFADARCVAISPGYRKSTGEDASTSICLDGTFKDNVFTVTLPATKNGGDDSSSTITLGLIEAQEETVAESNVTRAFLEIQGEEGNIKWYYDIGSLEFLMLTKPFRIKLQNMQPDLNNYIRDAIRQINALGFSIETVRTLPFKFIYSSKEPLAYGYFVQNGRNDEWNSIELNMTLLFKGIDETSIKQTIIHELLHYFQSTYDPRPPKKKCGGEEDIISEAASVWVEQFMDNGKLNSSFIQQYLPDFVRSYDNAKKYDSHGYGMSTLLYYLTHPMSEMDAFGIDKNSIVELFKLWKTDEPNYKYAGHTFITFEKWLMNHDCGFMITDEYDDYLLKLFTGKIIDPEFINLDNLGGGPSSVPQDAFKDKEKIEFSGECLSHGCRISKFSVVLRRPLKGKEIIVKQNEPDVRTYVLVQKDNSFVTLDGKAVAGDSIVISGDEMDSTYPNDRFVYLATINSNNTKQKFNISCEIRDAKATITPSEMTFPAEGGTQESKITAPSFSHFGVSVDNAYSSWLSATPAKGGKVMVTAMVNTTSEKRTGYVKCYVAKSADAPESEWVWLTPIKVTQEAGTVMEGWVLVNTEVIKHENTTGDRGQYMNYTASETELSKEGKVIGRIGPYKDVDKLFDLGYVTTIQALPTTLSAGDTLRIHITAKRTTEATIDKDYKNQVAYYDYMAVEMWWNVYNSSGYFGVENLDGPSGGPSSYSTATTSSWDFVYRVPSGSKDKEESIYLTACGSKVIWTYRWGGPSD